MKTAKEKAEEWKAYVDAPIREPGKTPTLAVGTVVRAIRLLDEGVTHIVPGTVGYVFGEADCYGDGAGPIVQWMTIPDESKNVGPVASIEEHFQKIVEARKVCNVYPDDIEIVRVHDTVVVGHLDRMPPPEALVALKRLLHHSWRDITYDYTRLTNTEKRLITPEQFESLKEWISPKVGDEVTARVRITEGGNGWPGDPDERDSDEMNFIHAEAGERGKITWVTGGVTVLFDRTGTEAEEVRWDDIDW